MKKIPPVMHEDLKKIFQSRDFCKGLKKSKEISLNVGYESQFFLWRETFSNKIKYFPILESTFSDGPDYSTYHHNFKDNAEIISRKLFPLVAYHCHGYPSLAPSLDDLKANMAMSISDSIISISGIGGDEFNKVTNFPLECIGGIKDRGKIIELLIFQNRQENPSIHYPEIIHSQLSQRIGKKIQDNYAIAEIINSLKDLRATLIEYRENKSSYKISEEDINKLKIFTYSPRISSEKLSFRDLMNIEAQL